MGQTFSGIAKMSYQFPLEPCSKNNHQMGRIWSNVCSYKEYFLLPDYASWNGQYHCCIVTNYAIHYAVLSPAINTLCVTVRGGVLVTVI